MMRKGIFTGLASFFTPMMLLLAGCGSGQMVLPNSFNSPSPFSQTNGLSSAGGTTSPSTSAAKSNDTELENYAQAIQSPSYEGKLMLTVESSDGLSLVNGRLAGSTTSSRAVAATVNGVLDNASGSAGSSGGAGSGATIKITGLFGKNVKLMKNRRRQLEIVSGKRIKDISTYFKITVADKTKAENILRGLWKRAGVRVVSPTVKPRPMGLETVPNLSGNQGYLRADGGLNAEAAWARGIRGAGVDVVVLEGGWNSNHENFSPSFGRFSTFGDRESRAHGTAILGILGAAHSDHGVKGIVSESNLSVSSGGVDGLNIRVNGYGSDSTPGGVFSISFGWGIGNVGVPVESAEVDFATIQIAAAEGMTVVEGGGNDGMNLNTLIGLENFVSEDSGAIIVGASMGADRRKAEWSSCGDRVNLFAWGWNVVTTSYPGSGWDWERSRPENFINDPAQPNLYYTDSFGGTSASAPMIAGVAALLQSYAKQQMGGKKFLTPEKVREILVASGVPAVGDENCRIGKQPRMDVALQLFDDYWAQVQRDFPELGGAEEIRGDRRRALRQAGVGLICKMYDPENSDLQCPEVAKCVLDRSLAQVRYERNPDTGNYTYNLYDANGFTIESDCRSTRCLPIDVARSDYDCMAGAIWPTGLRLAKTLDFDSDQKADLVNWTETKWQIVLSSAHPEIVAGDASRLNVWDIDLAVPRIAARWVWPVVEDYNSDGRADLAAYDKEHGVWYIKFTDSRLLRGDWGEGWDWQIQLPYRGDVLDRHPELTQYARPVPGDYNGDGYIDLALAKSDGVWSIDFGGPNLSNYGSFDRDVTYLTSEQLAQAPGWAYLPVVVVNTIDAMTTHHYFEYKTPDDVAGARQWWSVNLDGSISRFGDDAGFQPDFGGNDFIPFGDLSVKCFDGLWREWDFNTLSLTPAVPNESFGNLECHPFEAFYDGDSEIDRAVQCPAEFRIALSSTGELRRIPLLYNPAEFSLPGKPYFGSVSYATTQRLLSWMLRASPAAPAIPVDMVSGSICRLPLGRNMPQECR